MIIWLKWMNDWFAIAVVNTSKMWSCLFGFVSTLLLCLLSHLQLLYGLKNEQKMLTATPITMTNNKYVGKEEKISKLFEYYLCKFKKKIACNFDYKLEIACYFFFSSFLYFFILFLFLFWNFPICLSSLLSCSF